VGDEKQLRYGHWFDGDGFVSAITFTSAGECFFRQRYLRGPKFLAQERAGSRKIGSRGAWTQLGQGKWWQNVMRIPSNPLNTNVLVVEGKPGGQGQVLALCEGGPPYEMDPVTLDVKQEPELFAGDGGAADAGK
jgi:all-trans-8'-apo-beta-carotenal 15,15'-oxygenase